jgi:site-specific DNA-methyltransferase (adenine-specific)
MGASKAPAERVRHQAKPTNQQKRPITQCVRCNKKKGENMQHKELYNADCFDVFKDIGKHSVDCVIVDLPYGLTDYEWDTPIDLCMMWQELKRICKQYTNYIFFCTTKFGHELISSKPSFFRYDLVWQKNKVAGFLSSKKAPLRAHEMIYVFGSTTQDDLEKAHNHELRAYAKRIKEYINTPRKELKKIIGNDGVVHFFDWNGKQFALPTQKNYQILTEHFQLKKLDYFLDYETMQKMKDRVPRVKRYNPQMTKGKPYKKKGEKRPISAYGEFIRYHNSQKPDDLMDWLVLTYSNPGDVVLDFTMGSGSTGAACIRHERKFIGIEKDEKIFKVAADRLEKEALKYQKKGEEHATQNDEH